MSLLYLFIFVGRPSGTPPGLGPSASPAKRISSVLCLIHEVLKNLPIFINVRFEKFKAQGLSILWLCLNNNNLQYDILSSLSRPLRMTWQTGYGSCRLNLTRSMATRSETREYKIAGNRGRKEDNRNLRDFFPFPKKTPKQTKKYEKWSIIK